MNMSTMSHLERFRATVAREEVDRPATWLGVPDAASWPGLYERFGTTDMAVFKEKLGDDVWTVEMPYNSPTANAIYIALNFSKDPLSTDERTLTKPGFFEEITDPALVSSFDWPDPVDYIDPEACRQLVDEVPDGYAALGVIWSAHFQDACSAFGMETALINMLTEPEIFQAVIERITEFYLRGNEVFYEATKGKLHSVLIGNDFGSQLGPMVDPALLREFVLPGTKRLIDQAKSYGLSVVHHSCGSIFEIIPDLIDVGVDVIHPIQALAAKMEPWRL
ncbi:MAG: hypothetical protein LBR21_09990, partial [Propionibacteriaceae bacterium]|nr:hypothetical protein [Propionibacteriaceae bacterium]